MADDQSVRNIRDLKVYRAAYDLAMQVFEISKRFPKEETYSLTDQIRRSSRSVAGNIREGFAKRRYEQVLVKHFTDALGSSEETRTWLEVSRDCGYLSTEEYERLDKGYDEINAMLYVFVERWQSVTVGTD